MNIFKKKWIFWNEEWDIWHFVFLVLIIIIFLLSCNKKEISKIDKEIIKYDFTKDITIKRPTYLRDSCDYKKSKIICLIPRGIIRSEVFDVEQSWIHLSYDVVNGRGWVWARSLPSDCGYQNSLFDANIREFPSINSKILSIAPKGYGPCEYFEIIYDWAEIEYKGQRGWIYMKNTDLCRYASDESYLRDKYWTNVTSKY